MSVAHKLVRAWFVGLSLAIIFCLLSADKLNAQDMQSITDAQGRTIEIPADVERVICSGPGALRLLTYLQGQDLVVAVDSLEKRDAVQEARPYAVANPQYQEYPLFGEFRGRDNPELIADLEPQPQVILRTYPESGHDPDQVQQKTGVPVLTLEYGNLTFAREDLDQSLRIMGQILGLEERAEEVIQFFDKLQNDLKERTADIPAEERPGTYIGGVAYRGPHGFRSTEPAYAPFEFVGALNVSSELASQERASSHATVAKEKILFWDPEIIFVDVSSLRLDQGTNALDQLRQDPAYQSLSAVEQGRIHGVFPYNSYTQNFEAVFANAYYIGKVLYPEQFRDVDPLQKAEEISEFLNGAPAFEQINSRLEQQAFNRIELQ